MPSSDVCAGCHQQLWTAHREVEPVMSSIETRIPVSWRRVHDVPDFAFFDHSIHVETGIGCVTCHGRVDQMSLVHQTETLEMQWCLECHRQPEKYVRPREEVFNMQWTPPEDPEELAELARTLEIRSVPTSSAELRRALVNKYDIQQYTSCSNCHQ